MRLGRAWIIVVLAVVGLGRADASDADQTSPECAMLKRLDAPLLFVKRHSYQGIHIYDTYYKWPPGGGGIYVLETAQAPREQWKIRPVIDPATPETLGVGVYTHPELSFDAKRLLFCFKGEPQGSTSIYEIGIDGLGLRRLTDPAACCDCYQGSQAGQHDVAPAYLPDGRIVFLSTRPSGLVPCNNTGVAILHVMNADGSDMHPISVNNVNEFDPSVLPDGRILFGRWEYIDKNALTIQSLWTVHPDGTEETAFFANNMVFPEAILDARPVPGSQLVVGTFAKHNAPPRGSIALVDPRRGKNNPGAIANLEHPDDPTFDQGNSCEPWPIGEDLVLFSGRPDGQDRNVIELIDRAGHRTVVLSDPEICLHSPMLVKPRPVPLMIPEVVDRQATSGRFFVQDIYRGLEGVKPGEVKWLRVVEETSRRSPTLMGGSPYNQTFLVSAALAFSVKNYLGIVPVEDDGSAYFEVPAGRAVYLQALDADGRLVQSMRSFVQAAPGTTRSCIGCHENKSGTSQSAAALPQITGREPRQLQPESWGSGYLDYASMVQPVLDRRCVRCHGGREGIAAGMDLSGGWTEHFNISYESLVNRRETQLTAYWIAGIDCMNGTALWSSRIFRPRAHGSGAAPLAELLVKGHGGRIPDLTRDERDLLLAWIDSNGVYHGTWDATESGCAIREWNGTKAALVNQMQKTGCLRCHGEEDKIAYFENDWINLKDPELSRILRAPLAGGAGLGLALCRDRKVDPRRQRIHLLWNGYAHAVQPPELFPHQTPLPPDPTGEPVVSFASTGDPAYQAMLKVIRQSRQKALLTPRVDMPGAEVVAGSCRTFVPPPVPEGAPALRAAVDGEGIVELAWERSARTIGPVAELHRSDRKDFAPTEATLVLATPLAQHTDEQAAAGRQYYALVLAAGAERSKPSYVAVDVPPAPAPPTPTNLSVVPSSSAIQLQWQEPDSPVWGYRVYRSKAGDAAERITERLVRLTSYADPDVELDVAYRYFVCAVSRRGIESQPSSPVEAVAKVIKEPVFVAQFDGGPQGLCFGGDVLPGRFQGPARAERGLLDLRQGGFATFAHDSRFDLAQDLSLECWVRFDQAGRMPVVVSCGQWQQAGWFLQRLGGVWRWHVGGVDCDGGKPTEGRWMHLVAVFAGDTARLYENGVPVAERSGSFHRSVWPGELHIGQYSAQPGPDFQVIGSIAGVKIYHRALKPDEIAEAAKRMPE